MISDIRGPVVVAIALYCVDPFPLLAGEAFTLDSHWSECSPMPTARSEIACAKIGNKVYVAGGVALDGSKDAFECYDPERDRWEKLAALPVELNHCGIAASNGRIYVSGGFLNLRQTRFSDKLYEYIPSEDEWTERGTMPGIRHKHFMISRKDWLHLVGGLLTREVWSYHIPSGKWSTNRLAPLPAKRDHIGLLQDASHLYVVGGRKDRIVEADCWRYDFGRREWSAFATLPCPRGAPVALLDRGRIHVVGGEDLQSHETYRRHDIFDLATGKWSPGTPLPRPRHGMCSIFHRGEWFVIGGGGKAGLGTLFSAKRQVERLALH